MCLCMESKFVNTWHFLSLLTNKELHLLHNETITMSEIRVPNKLRSNNKNKEKNGEEEEQNESLHF